MSVLGIEEYLFTFGILVAFVGTIVSVVLSRKHIFHVFKEIGTKKWHILLMLLITAMFITADLAIIKPTQQLFFDDAIYQGGAQDLIHMGQSWMCDYGTPNVCYTGEIFHEPVGTSFTLALGFLFFGVKLAVTYNTMLIVSIIAVILAFAVGSVMLKNPVVGLFSQLLVALSPIVLLWSRSTTSDMPNLAYSLLAVFLMLIFSRRKSAATFAGFAFSLAFVTYMKVDSVIYIPVIILMYLVLDDKNIKSSIINNLRRVKRNVFNTKALVIVLLFFVAIVPEITYSYIELTTGSYGYQGTFVQQTCIAKFTTITPNASISIQNFNANICANLAFWFNSFESSYIIQPIIFTFLGIIGAAIMMVVKRRELLALGIWFISLFVLFTAFYAGGVTYGVDWRFMLALIAPSCIFGGYAASLAYTEGFFRRKRKRMFKIIRVCAYAIVVGIILYPIFTLEPLLAINPSQIQQAGDARFYENFVYSNISAVPSSCLIFSYDPTLMNINNRTSTQMFNLYPQSYETYKQQYPCLVLDYGYWCYTPNNTCTYVENTFTLQNIVNATYTQEDKLFGFYYITGLKNTTG